MKWLIKKQIQFAGIVVRPHATEGSIQTRSAGTSLDGNSFDSLKSRIFDTYAKYVNWDVNKYDSLIVIFNPDETTSILINEIQFTNYNDHEVVSGIRRNKLKLIGMEIPEESGILIYLTWRTHHLAMYDVTPVIMRSEEIKTGQERDKRRPEDYELVLGALVDEIDCQTVYAISNDEWQDVFDAGWFPFAFLQGNLWRELIEKIHQHEDLSEFTEKIAGIISSTWDTRIHLWRLHPILKNEIDFLESAYESFVAQNWIAVNSILGPRIEGVITGAVGRFLKHKQMVSAFNAAIDQNDRGNQILKAEKLMEYLTRVVYKDVNMMNPGNKNAGINRHLLGHGRVRAETLDQQSAVIRFLIMDHISRYNPSTTAPNPAST
ncbi:MAG: hypothetical protein JXA33_24770 [Anaerolineae bacterium]|nr:hypothetical protein [Anaerolineae bacterium]